MLVLIFLTLSAQKDLQYCLGCSESEIEKVNENNISDIFKDIDSTTSRILFFVDSTTSENSIIRFPDGMKIFELNITTHLKDPPRIKINMTRANKKIFQLAVCGVILKDISGGPFKLSALVLDENSKFVANINYVEHISLHENHICDYDFGSLKDISLISSSNSFVVSGDIVMFSQASVRMPLTIITKAEEIFISSDKYLTSNVTIAGNYSRAVFSNFSYANLHTGRIILQTPKQLLIDPYYYMPLTFGSNVNDVTINLSADVDFSSPIIFENSNINIKTTGSGILKLNQMQLTNHGDIKLNINGEKNIKEIIINYAASLNIQSPLNIDSMYIKAVEHIIYSSSERSEIKFIRYENIYNSPMIFDVVDLNPITVNNFTVVPFNEKGSTYKWGLVNSNSASSFAFHIQSRAEEDPNFRFHIRQEGYTFKIEREFAPKISPTLTPTQTTSPTRDAVTEDSLLGSLIAGPFVGITVGAVCGFFIFKKCRKSTQNREDFL